MLIESRASMRWVVRWFVFIAAVQPTLGHPAIEQESAKISQVGEWAWDIRDGDTVNRIFKYERLLISGKLTLQEYLDALAALKPSRKPMSTPACYLPIAIRRIKTLAS